MFPGAKYLNVSGVFLIVEPLDYKIWASTYLECMISFFSFLFTSVQRITGSLQTKCLLLTLSSLIIVWTGIRQPPSGVCYYRDVLKSVLTFFNLKQVILLVLTVQIYQNAFPFLCSLFLLSSQIFYLDSFVFCQGLLVAWSLLENEFRISPLLNIFCWMQTPGITLFIGKVTILLVLQGEKSFGSEFNMQKISYQMHH